MTSSFEYNGPKNKFRNSNGQRLLSGLFFELNKVKPSQILYTLKRYDHKLYPSLFRLYMEMENLNEYKFAITYFEDWEHWELLTRSFFFKEYIWKWRNELKLKVESEAIEQIRREAKDEESKNRFQANKILIDRPWETKEAKGRPSKAQVEAKVKDIAENENRLNDDLKRITEGLDE